MSLIVSENGSGGGFPLLPEGSYAAVCYMLVDLGLQENERFGNSTRKVLIGWELVDELIELDGEKKPRIFSARYTASLNEKSKLRKDLAAWRGRDFTDSELASFDLKNVVWVPCLIQIIHRENNGKTYANLASIMKLPKGMTIPAPTLQPVIFDLDESPLDMLNELPEWIARLIQNSESYQARVMSESRISEPIGNAAEFEVLPDEDGTPF